MDIEDLSAALEFSSRLPEGAPYKRWKTPRGLSVTDMSSQLWCEKQAEFVLETGIKRRTAAMIAGTARHDELERLDHDIEEIEVETAEDQLGVRLWNALMLITQVCRKGEAREIPVFGVIQGALFRGIIDEVRIVEESFKGRCGRWTVIGDTKTRRQETMPSMSQQQGSAFQLQLYYRLLKDLRDGVTPIEPMLQSWGVAFEGRFKSDALTSSFESIDELWPAVLEAAAGLPEIRPEMEVAYDFNGKEFHRSRIPYAERAVMFQLRELLQWWKGDRHAEGVQPREAWKCRYCDFLLGCPLTPLTAEQISEEIAKRTQELEQPQQQEQEQQEGAAAVDNNNNINTDKGPESAPQLGGPNDSPSDKPQADKRPDAPHPSPSPAAGAAAATPSTGDGSSASGPQPPRPPQAAAAVGGVRRVNQVRGPHPLPPPRGAGGVPRGVPRGVPGRGMVPRRPPPPPNLQAPAAVGAPPEANDGRGRGVMQRGRGRAGYGNGRGFVNRPVRPPFAAAGGTR